ncbi:HTH domain-containing protein [Amedibacillus sp. YH-ame6]
MGVNHFTEEQLKILRDNPYVENATEKAITYTEGFREEFFLKYSLEEKIPSLILYEMGFDPKVLGRKRIDNIVQRVKKQSTRIEGFRDIRTDNVGRQKTREMSTEDELVYLKHKIALQSQQIEALKKINTINRKASWIQQKKNSK